MLRTLGVASLAALLALSPLAAFAETDMSGGAMPDKTMSKSMAPKKPMMKHHSPHKKPMAKMDDGAMQPKM